MDVLIGEMGADRFILGTQANAQVFYKGNGDSDYAWITDFDAVNDVIHLKGNLSEYTLQIDNYRVGAFFTQDTGIYHGNDLIAVLQDVSGLTLSSSSSSGPFYAIG